MKKSTSTRPNILIKIKNYFVGVVYQARKVRWPGRQQLYITTIVVLTFCTLFAIYLGVANEIIKYMFEALGMKG